MGVAIPKGIVGLRGQVVKSIELEGPGVVRVHCRRDARYQPVDARTGQVGRINRRLRRTVWDVPLFGHRVALDIEYLEIAIGARDRRVEQLPFVDAGGRLSPIAVMEPAKIGVMAPLEGSENGVSDGGKNQLFLVPLASPDFAVLSVLGLSVSSSGLGSR
ncbi:MAG: hypothetical protein OSA97_13935 [Nevskia sp.]|nr:hypothetical protein [Nevskia sp.]